MCLHQRELVEFTFHQVGVASFTGVLPEYFRAPIQPEESSRFRFVVAEPDLLRFILGIAQLDAADRGGGGVVGEHEPPAIVADSLRLGLEHVVREVLLRSDHSVPIGVRSKVSERGKHPYPESREGRRGEPSLLQVGHRGLRVRELFSEIR